MKASALPWTAALAACALLAGSVETLGWNNLSRIVQTQTMLIRQKATKEQIQVAEQRAKVYYARLTPAKKAVLAKKKVRYIAVETVRSTKTSPKAAKTVMIWDTQSQSLADSYVYDVETAPAVGQTAKFDTYSAAYVGTGS